MQCKKYATNLTYSYSCCCWFLLISSCSWMWEYNPFRGYGNGSPLSKSSPESGSLSPLRLSSSFTTRFRDYIVARDHARPFAASNAVVRFELRPTCLDRQRVQFLLVTSTSAISAFTWHRIGGHTRTFVLRVAHWLLQRSPGGRAESDE